MHVHLLKNPKVIVSRYILFVNLLLLFLFLCVCVCCFCLFAFCLLPSNDVQFASDYYKTILI